MPIVLSFMHMVALFMQVVHFCMLGGVGRGVDDGRQTESFCKGPRQTESLARGARQTESLLEDLRETDSLLKAPVKQNPP